MVCQLVKPFSKVLVQNFLVVSRYQNPAFCLKGRKTIYHVELHAHRTFGFTVLEHRPFWAYFYSGICRICDPILWNHIPFHWKIMRQIEINSTYMYKSIRNCSMRKTKLNKIDQKHPSYGLKLLNGEHGVVVNGEPGVVVRAFGLYWGDIRFESYHCWSLSKSFIPRLVVWSVTQNNACGGGEKQNKKSNGERQTFVPLGKSLWNHSFKPTIAWPLCCKYVCKYHSLLWWDSIRKGADLNKQNCLFGVHHAAMGKINFFLLLQ